MRTFKWIGICVLLVAILTGCSSPPGKAFVAGPEGLKITMEGKDENTSNIVIVAGVDTIKIPLYKEDRLNWYYDVPQGKSEYVIVGYYLTYDYPNHADIHMWITSKPKDFGK